MSILNQNSLSSLQKSSEGALSTFRKTIAKLESINQRAMAQSVAKAEQANKLKQECNDLDQLCQDNKNVANKIKQLIQ